MIKAFTTVSGLIFLSRLLGCVREILIAAFIGPGMVSDAFFLGFRLPNTFRRLFAEGAFNSAFVPLFTKIWHENKEKASYFASNALSYLVCALILLTLFFEVFMPYLMKGLAAGFKDAEKFQLVVTFARIMFPYILLVSVSSLFMSVLNSLHFFGAASASSVILNVNAVLCLWIFSSPAHLTAEVLSWSVPFSGVVQLIFLYAVSRQHIHIRLCMPRWTATMKTFFRKMLPGVYGAGIYQLNMVASDIIASFIPSAISYLSFADRVNQFPLGLIGASMGLILLPTLSKHFSNQEVEQALRSQNQAILTTLFLSIPAAFGLFILAEPIVFTLYQHKHFTVDDALATASCLQAFVVGLPAFVLVKVLTNNYFARGDTKTPVRITTFILGLNITLNLILSQFYSYVGIALGTSLAYWIHAILLVVLLKRLEFFHLERTLVLRVVRVFFAALGMAGGLVLLRSKVLFFQQQKSILMVASFLICGFLLYLFFCEVFGLKPRKFIKKKKL